MVRTQIQLTEEQAKLLKALASTHHVSVAELIRRSVDKLICSSGAIDAEEQRQRAIAAAGRFHSGRSDVSSEHDRHLTEAFKS